MKEEIKQGGGVSRKTNPIVRGLYVAGGTVALGLAFLGIFVPGLPVTPLALLAGWLYARSSEKLYRRLLENKYLGKKIRNYHEKGGVSRKGKVVIILLMSAMVLISAFCVLPDSPLRYIVLGLGVIGGLVVCFWVPTVAE